MSNQMKYDPKAFSSGLWFTSSYVKQMKAVQQNTKSILKELAEITEKNKRDHIKWKHKHIKWDMKYAIFLAVVGIFHFITTILKWNYSPDNCHPADFGLIFNAGFFWSMSCIIYRRRKEQLKELFIDAI